MLKRLNMMDWLKKLKLLIQTSKIFKKMKILIKHSVDRTVCTLPLSAGGGLNRLLNFQKVARGLTRSQFSEAVAGKDWGGGGWGCSFYIKIN